MSMRVLFCAALVLTVLTESASAQEQIFNSRDDFQEKTGYGTIALNKNATTASQSRYVYKNYVVIPQNGQINVPDQSGYCFVINHYNSANGGMEYAYTFRITKHFLDGRTLADDFRNSYKPTDLAGSWRMPDYCLRRVSGLTKVEIVTGSSEPEAFDHNFWFNIQPQ